MKIKKWEIAIILMIIVATVSVFSVSSQQAQLSDKLIRLHVIANSDSIRDQELKLSVRDSVLDLSQELLNDCRNKSEAVEILENNLHSIANTSREVLRLHGDTKNVAVSLGTEVYPTREYDTFSLPAGDYISLKVVIGEGDGQNWWCVLFPPLCTANSIDFDNEALFDLTTNEIDLITGNGNDIKIKFKIMELLNKLRDIV